MIDKATKKMNSKQLKEEIYKNKKDLLNFNFQKSTGQLEKTHEIRKTKKTIARLKTEFTKTMREENA